MLSLVSLGPNSQQYEERYAHGGRDRASSGDKSSGKAPARAHRRQEPSAATAREKGLDLVGGPARASRRGLLAMAQTQDLFT
jgi:hypothetical protein